MRCPPAITAASRGPPSPLPLQEYKSAASFLVRRGSTRAEREALRATLASLSGQLVAGISQGRGLPAKQVGLASSPVGAASCLAPGAAPMPARQGPLAPEGSAHHPAARAPSHASAPLDRCVPPSTRRPTCRWTRSGWASLTPACTETRR